MPLSFLQIMGINYHIIYIYSDHLCDYLYHISDGNILLIWLSLLNNMERGLVLCAVLESYINLFIWDFTSLSTLYRSYHDR